MKNKKLIVNINNRRYLGNKYKLLPFIKRTVAENCTCIETFADLFAGTGAVSSAFIDKRLITNDILYSNYISHIAWFGSEPYNENKIIRYIFAYNELQTDEENYMTINFSNTYFSRNVCSKIGYIRENIETEYNNGNINNREYAILITSLLYAMDKIANTCGHYDAYRKNGKFNKPLIMSVPSASQNIGSNNLCYNMDANKLAGLITADIVYLDPPYNSRQYCDAYHLIENVAQWKKPDVYGIAKKMDRTCLKSDYCTQKASKAFENLISKIHARYILLSYNNMAKEGDERSNAKIPDSEIMRVLLVKGTVRIFSETYKSFTTGKSNRCNNKERLFLCKC